MTLIKLKNFFQKILMLYQVFIPSEVLPLSLNNISMASLNDGSDKKLFTGQRNQTVIFFLPHITTLTMLKMEHNRQLWQLEWEVLLAVHILQSTCQLQMITYFAWCYISFLVTHSKNIKIFQEFLKSKLKLFFHDNIQDLLKM